MLAKLHHDPFSDENRIYERKPDGMRVRIFKHKDEVNILLRNRKDQSKVFPELLELIKKPTEEVKEK